MENNTQLEDSNELSNIMEDKINAANDAIHTNKTTTVTIKGTKSLLS